MQRNSDLMNAMDHHPPTNPHDSLLAAVRSRLVFERQAPAAELAREQLALAEAAVGFAIPALLSELYRDLGNGGFGPGRRLLGLGGGQRDDEGRTADECFRWLLAGDAERDDWNWPVRLLPICTWGCAVYSCVDCSEPTLPVVRFDPNRQRPGQLFSACFWEEGYELAEWLLAWSQGRDLFSRHRCSM